MHKAIIFVYGEPDPVDRYEVDNYEIDGNVVIAEYGNEKWIFPLTAIYAIEVLHDN